MRHLLEIGKGTLLSVLATAICLFPLWIFLGVRHLVDPEKFWQELAMGVMGYVVLGGFQVICLIALMFIMIIIWGGVKINIDFEYRRHPRS